MEAHRQLTCPICMKSYGDMHPTWSRLDQEIASTPMPAEYASWQVTPAASCAEAHTLPVDRDLAADSQGWFVGQVDVLCNDCLIPGRVSFHIFGLKCPHCQSYNTRRIGLDRQGGTPGAENGGQQPPSAAP